ncbi:MAG: hypothetical protein KGH72_04115 [Candidatus Micrarchaeota archaeon]|nr:hypothetical protein [Candidatus Micrarchaeota archaeon]
MNYAYVLAGVMVLILIGIAYYIFSMPQSIAATTSQTTTVAAVTSLNLSSGNCGSYSIGAASRNTTIENAEQCLLNAFNTGKSANLFITYFGVDSGTKYNMTTESNGTVRVNQTSYLAPHFHNSTIIYCSSLNATYDPSLHSFDNFNGLVLSSCTNKQQIYLPMR